MDALQSWWLIDSTERNAHLLLDLGLHWIILVVLISALRIDIWRARSILILKGLIRLLVGDLIIIRLLLGLILILKLS